MALTGGHPLKEGGVYFKVKGIIHLKFQNSVNISLQITITTFMIYGLNSLMTGGNKKITHT